MLHDYWLLDDISARPNLDRLIPISDRDIYMHDQLDQLTIVSKCAGVGMDDVNMD